MTICLRSSSSSSAALSALCVLIAARMQMKINRWLRRNEEVLLASWVHQCGSECNEQSMRAVTQVRKWLQE
ncbi:unnamed protein product [Ceratitis capitata]|uniref:(Mediterranean fruit fly) hypothetical protein n=1 Tax=Ceratitis capitata TaxID=7213 RepID=A0A811UXH6_CERCA|nr:unnamed protein product [Ceratitis capitata]